MLGVSIFVAKTEEAKEKYDLDKPFPTLEDADLNFSSRQQMMIDIARKHNFSIRQLYEYIASARGHWTLVGTPKQVVDQLQQWLKMKGLMALTSYLQPRLLV